MASGFRLEKWYLDLTAESGEAAIVYAATLSYAGLEVPYQSLLHRSADGRVSSRGALRRPPGLAVEGGSLSAELPQLGLAGRWESRLPAVRDTVVETEHGSIDWHCLLPLAQARLTLDGRALEGSGYAERLVMTLPPWRLPFRSLQWGRYTSARHALVWTDLGGGTSYRRVYLDGRPVQASLSDPPFALEAEGVALGLEEVAPLREGRLGETALALLPAAIREHFPKSALGIDEHKFLSRGRLRLGAQEDLGRVIHERVSFG